MNFLLFIKRGCPDSERFQRNLHEADIDYESVDMNNKNGIHKKEYFSFVKRSPTLVIIINNKIEDSIHGSLSVVQLIELKNKYIGRQI